MKNRSVLICHSVFEYFLALPASDAAAAQFDIDAQRTILRQLQFCDDCGAALLVTGVHPGVLVRRPDCGKEQPRLPAEHVLTQVYQTCSLCEAPLDAHGRHAGEVVECTLCHTRQVLSRDAFPPASLTAGLGYLPGFPPGSGKKKLLYSPEHADALITPIPLETNTPFDPLADLDIRPAAGVARTPIPQPPLLPAAPRAPIPQPPTLPELAVAQPSRSAPPAPTPEQIAQPGTAITVPSVTADLFGGKRGQTGRTDSRPAASPLSGDIVARVDGTPIFTAEIDRIANPVMHQLRQRADPDELEELALREKELRSQILERLIDRELVMKEAERTNHRPELALVRRREADLLRALGDNPGVDVRKEAERDIVMNDMRRRFSEKPGSARPEAVREMYRANVDKLQQPRLLALGQLAIFADRSGRTDSRPYQEIAAEVAGLLERGERFDDVRARYDEFGPAVGLDVPEPMLLPESAYSSRLMAMAGSLRKGAVFGPIPMEGMILFGKVVDERPAGPIPFEQVEKEIRQRVESEATERAFEDWLKSLRQRSVVELYDM